MKDFISWNNEKVQTDQQIRPIPYFAEGDIWWIKLGLNIGIEINGKGEHFTRPVLIIKKYNQYSFLCAPLSTRMNLNKYRIILCEINNKISVVNLSQLRNVDSKRLVRKIFHISKILFDGIKRKASEVNFS
ncbi:MAG: hypothetical protein RJB39_410 [Candidatus Parcubacteria bacterium]|jgi:mRNA interferase MazF